MLKEVFASNVAKLVAACVCPLAGASAIALKVPQVRAAVHKVTEPRAAQAKPKAKSPEVREARAKPRVRMPIRPAIAPDIEFASGMMCPQPVQFSDAPLGTGGVQPALVLAPPVAPIVQVNQQMTMINCPTINGGGGIILAGTNMVPEPATWAQMVAGFGLMGGLIRSGRRRQTRAARV